MTLGDSHRPGWMDMEASYLHVLPLSLTFKLDMRGIETSRLFCTVLVAFSMTSILHSLFISLKCSQETTYHPLSPSYEPFSAFSCAWPCYLEFPLPHCFWDCFCPHLDGLPISAKMSLSNSIGFEEMPLWTVGQVCELSQKIVISTLTRWHTVPNSELGYLESSWSLASDLELPPAESHTLLVACSRGVISIVV